MLDRGANKRWRWMMRAPWWERVLAGVRTAVPGEWEQEDGSIKLAGESAVEFFKALEEHSVEHTPEMLGQIYDAVIRYVIEKTGQHPDGMSREEWEETYE